MSISQVFGSDVQDFDNVDLIVSCHIFSQGEVNFCPDLRWILMGSQVITMLPRTGVSERNRHNSLRPP